MHRVRARAHRREHQAARLRDRLADARGLPDLQVLEGVPVQAILLPQVAPTRNGRDAPVKPQGVQSGMPQTPLASSESLLEELRTWVEIETPTTEPAAVNRLM